MVVDGSVKSICDLKGTTVASEPNLPEVFAGILAIGVIGLATDQAIRWLHRRMFPYLG